MRSLCDEAEYRMRHEVPRDDRSFKQLLRWVFEGVESALLEIGNENEGVLDSVR